VCYFRNPTCMNGSDKQRLLDYLGHMLEAIGRINRYITGLSGVVEMTTPGQISFLRRHKWGI